MTKYIEAIGRRKTAIARVRIVPATKNAVTVNGKEAREYFKTEDQVKTIFDTFTKKAGPDSFAVTVKVVSGGIHAQAEAIRHGLARALSEFNPDSRHDLKKAGFLKRDPRSKERRKFGLKKARKAPQWSKR